MKMISRFFFYSLSSTLIIFLASCSNNSSVNTFQEVQTGSVVAVNQTVIRAKPIKPRANVGVSIGSGGRSGLYGAVDILTLGSLLGIKKKDKVIQEVIIRRSNGTLVAVTQPFHAMFRRGDQIKIVKQDGEARVTY